MHIASAMCSVSFSSVRIPSPSHPTPPLPYPPSSVGKRRSVEGFFAKFKVFIFYNFACFDLLIELCLRMHHLTFKISFFFFWRVSPEHHTWESRSTTPQQHLSFVFFFFKSIRLQRFYKGSYGSPSKISRGICNLSPPPGPVSSAPHVLVTGGILIYVIHPRLCRGGGVGGGQAWSSSAEARFLQVGKKLGTTRFIEMWIGRVRQNKDKQNHLQIGSVYRIIDTKFTKIKRNGKLTLRGGCPSPCNTTLPEVLSYTSPHPPKKKTILDLNSTCILKFISVS